MKLVDKKQTNEPLEDIIMNLNRDTIARIVNNALEDHLSGIIDSAVRRVTDELDNLSGEIESVISDAISSGTRAGEGVEPEDVDALHEKIVNDVMAELADKNLEAPALPPAPKEPSIAERVDSGMMSTLEALHLTLGMRRLTDAEVTQHLDLLSKQYESQFAVFLWRRAKGQVTL